MSSEHGTDRLKRRIIELEKEVALRADSENALKASQRILSTLLSNLPGMAYRCKNDAQWTMEFVSDGCYPLTGYHPEQLTWNRKASYAELIHPEDQENVRDGVQAALEHNETFRLSYRLRTADGEEKWVSEQGIGIFSPEGELIALEGFVSDITEQKSTSEQLSVLLDSLPIVPYMCKADDHFAITYVGSTVEEITGFTQAQFVGDPIFWFDHVHPDDRKTLFARLRKLFELENSQYEYRFRVSDMSFRWFRDIRRAVKLPDGRMSHFVGTWQDITEEKALLRESEYRLQQVIHADKLASLGEVVAGVAHEINNPGGFITNNIPLLEETWEMLEPVLKQAGEEHPALKISGFEISELCRDMETIIESIKTGSDRINRVVAHLKDFSRIDKSGEAKPVQLNDVIENAYTIVGAQVRKSAPRVELHYAEKLPQIHGHFQKLEQVAANLLVNAANAVSGSQEGRVTVATRAIERLGAVVFVVEDNGMGMDSNVMTQIFEPFFTTRRDSGGTGLGLSVSYNLVREHRGVIGVLSKPGKGTRFSVILPRDPDASLDLRPLTLCMDDDRRFLHKLKSDLSQIMTMPFESRIHPEKVLTCLEQHPEVDILLLKIMIPENDGWELYRQIRSKFPLLTMILYCGETISLRHRPLNTPEPDHILEKPFGMKQLIHIINSTQRQIL